MLSDLANMEQNEHTFWKWLLMFKRHHTSCAGLKLKITASIVYTHGEN